VSIILGTTIIADSTKGDFQALQEALLPFAETPEEQALFVDQNITVTDVRKVLEVDGDKDKFEDGDVAVFRIKQEYLRVLGRDEEGERLLRQFMRLDDILSLHAYTLEKLSETVSE